MYPKHLLPKENSEIIKNIDENINLYRYLDNINNMKDIDDPNIIVKANQVQDMSVNMSPPSKPEDIYYQVINKELSYAKFIPNQSIIPKIENIEYTIKEGSYFYLSVKIVNTFKADIPKNVNSKINKVIYILKVSHEPNIINYSHAEIQIFDNTSNKIKNISKDKSWCKALIHTIQAFYLTNAIFAK